MTFVTGLAAAKFIAMKRLRVRARHEECLRFWMEEVAQGYLSESKEHDYRSLIVASAIAASIAPISQKRTTTCVSVQPLRWK